MNYFPAFIKLENRKILIIGGGEVAHRKLIKLLEFTSNITIIASNISEPMLKTIKLHNLQYILKDYQKKDIEKFHIAIIAINSLTLQKEIYIEAQKYNCLCNCVDLIEYCDFIFPSYIKEENLTIAISTNGISPSISKHLKNHIKKSLPKELTKFLKEMKSLRESIPKGKSRMEFFKKKVASYFKV